MSQIRIEGTSTVTPAEVLTIVGSEGMRLSMSGQGSVLLAGTYLDVPARFACTIVGYVLMNSARVGATDQISIDVRKCTAAQYASNPYPTASIVAAAPITFSSAGDYIRTDNTITGWTTSVAAGDVLRFYVSSATAITNCSIMLKVQRV